MSAQSFDQPVSIDLLKAAGVSSLAVASTTTAYTYTFRLPINPDAKFSLEYKFTSAGAVDVNIWLEQSNEEVATEGSADTNYVIPLGTSVIKDAEATETVQIIAFTPVVSKFARIKIVGDGSNAATTVIDKCVVTIAK